MMGYIYKITNNINNKIYIGQTTKDRATDRFSQHRYLAQHPEQEKGVSYLHSSMAKYGVDNFTFTVIEEVDNELLNERERYWIASCESLVPKGYNMTEGGEGTQGYSRSQTEEEREKRRQSNKQFFIDHPEAKEVLSERAKKLWEDDEYRKKVTESNKKYAQEHPDLNKGENNPMYGKQHTEEALTKIRAHAAARKLKIVQLDKNTLEEIQTFDGVKDAEKALGVSHGWLSKAAREGRVAYGYRWKFI